MFIDESNAIRIIGEELYYDCISLFQEIFERKCDYKVIMTRRCFSLFKIFSPILFQKGITNQYGEIITDKAISFHYDKIVDSLNASINGNNISTLIVDDIIIFGRTINAIIDSVLSKFGDDYLKDQLTDHILVKCIMKNKYCSQIKNEYLKMVLSQSVGSKSDWKRLSCEFSTLIKSSNIANTSYIISYTADYKDIWNLDAFRELCCNTMINMTTKELKDLNVLSYVIDANIRDDILSKYVSCCWLRIYFYEALNSIVISPLVILKEMDTEEISRVAGALRLGNKSCFKELLMTNDIQYYSAKLRLMILLLSHGLLCSFLNSQNFLECSLEKFDYQEILKYNFTDRFAREFNLVHKTVCDSKFNNFEFNRYNGLDIIDEDEVEEFIFRRAMMDNEVAVSEESKRLEGISSIENKSVFSFSVMPKILSLIDNGKAALKSFFDNMNKRFVTLAYPGEQAFRIMEDKFKKYLIYLHHIERYSKIHEKDAYDLYKDFVLYLKGYDSVDKTEIELLMKYICILKDTNQHISDVYVYDLMSRDSSIEEIYESFIKLVRKNQNAR